MQRRVDDCPYRSNVRRLAGRELAECGVIERRFSSGSAAGPVPRDVCEQCCLAAPPAADRLNDVIASPVYLRARRALDTNSERAALAEAARARDEAVDGLKVLWSTLNNYRWTGMVYNLRAMAEIIDPAVNPDTLARHLRRGEPFAYLRYGDGEWLSILGRIGSNTDGHGFFPETLGRELGRILESAARLWPSNDRIYMGINAIVFQDAIRRYLVENDIAYRIHCVSDNLFVLGYRDFSTRRFLEAVNDFRGPKILAGNETLAPVAAGLGCRHVVVPRTDAYREIDRLERECRFTGPGLLVCCAGMTAECLISRVHAGNPDGSYVDCGHIFDAFVGNLSRDYAQDNGDGILDFLFEHYAPLVFGKLARRGVPHGT